jgi:hypothetical protein
MLLPNLFELCPERLLAALHDRVVPLDSGKGFFDLGGSPGFLLPQAL